MRITFLLLISAVLTVTLLGGLTAQTPKVEAPSATLQSTPNAQNMQQSGDKALTNIPLPTVDTQDNTFVAEEAISQETNVYSFGDPAGCLSSAQPDLTSEKMLANVQAALGDSVNLAQRRQTYIWNGELGTMVDVSESNYAFEFIFNEFQHPLTYKGDRVATIFLTNGFVIWFRVYDGNFRLLAIPMMAGVYDSPWAGYLKAYWEINGAPVDNTIYPVMKKIPCHWVIDQGFVSNEKLAEMFNLDWEIPDYLSSGRQYLASTCEEANKISQEKIGYWDATSMCGPLAWTLMRDANGFPYRIGSWSANAKAFTSANPKWNSQPWGSFDPETFDLKQTDEPMPGYDFAGKGDLYPGDIIYSYSTLYKIENDEHFDHIFLVAGIDENNARVSISNMVQNYPYIDCFISEVILYTPNDRQTGVINFEWNGNHFGKTGTSGFDVFRWKWITYHVSGQPMQYSVRTGDTLETIAFDWKISPDSIATANQFSPFAQLAPGQIINLPVP
jgi:hypothetical protein